MDGIILGVGKDYISCKTDCMYLGAGGGGEISTNIITISEGGGDSMEIQLVPG